MKGHSQKKISNTVRKNTIKSHVSKKHTLNNRRIISKRSLKKGGSTSAKGSKSLLSSAGEKIKKSWGSIMRHIPTQLPSAIQERSKQVENLLGLSPKCQAGLLVVIAALIAVCVQHRTKLVHLSLDNVKGIIATIGTTLGLALLAQHKSQGLTAEGKSGIIAHFRQLVGGKAFIKKHLEAAAEAAAAASASAAAEAAAAAAAEDAAKPLARAKAAGVKAIETGKKGVIVAGEIASATLGALANQARGSANAFSMATLALRARWDRMRRPEDDPGRLKEYSDAMDFGDFLNAGGGGLEQLVPKQAFGDLVSSISTMIRELIDKGGTHVRKIEIFFIAAIQHLIMMLKHAKNSKTIINILKMAGTVLASVVFILVANYMLNNKITDKVNEILDSGADRVKTLMNKKED